VSRIRIFTQNFLFRPSRYDSAIFVFSDAIGRCRTTFRTSCLSAKKMYQCMPRLDWRPIDFAGCSYKINMQKTWNMIARRRPTKHETQLASQQTQELRRKRWVFRTHLQGTKIRRRDRANSCYKRVFERQALFNAKEIISDGLNASY